MKRVVFTVALGKPKYGEMAMGLARSLHLIQDPTPRAILTDIEGFDWNRYFDYVIPPTEGRTALDKLRALDLTDADQVLALDCDMLAFRPVDDIFEHCQGMAFAVQGFAQSSGNWHGAPVQELCERFDRSSVPRFNGGMLYYERTPETQHLIERARAYEKDYANTGFVSFRGNASEEVCVSLAMLETGVGHVVRDEMDFQSTGVGMIGKPNVDVLRSECSFVCRRERVRFIRPYVFHAARYVNFVFYWRQLRTLARLEQLEDELPPGFRSTLLRWRRDVWRKWLRVRRTN